MRFTLITGPPRLVQCAGCLKECTAGSLPHVSASGRLLDTVYQDVKGGVYCDQCAAKIVESTDTTRSVKTFYADTRGEVIA